MKARAEPLQQVASRIWVCGFVFSHEQVKFVHLGGGMGENLEKSSCDALKKWL